MKTIELDQNEILKAVAHHAIRLGLKEPVTVKLIARHRPEDDKLELKAEVTEVGSDAPAGATKGE